MQFRSQVLNQTYLAIVLSGFMAMRVPAADPTDVQTVTVETKRAFENSLGMKFISVPGSETLFSVWKTRVKDYAAFIQSTRRDWRRPEFSQSSSDPVVDVSWEEAVAFCSWLTEKEQTNAFPQGWKYRLPKDAEWSIMVGLPPADAKTGVDANAQTLHPWGTAWPPPRGFANYHPSLGVDSFSHTSPVGSFKPNPLGLYDVGGNAWEWCEDRFNESADFRVLRGGSWRLRNPGDLLSSAKVGNQPDIHLDTYGFRCVIELPKLPPPTGPVVPAPAATAVK